MKSFIAFSVMSIWTITVLIVLYLIDAHINYREIEWSISIALALLVAHMVTIVIYFNITGQEPYKWFKT